MRENDIAIKWLLIGVILGVVPILLSSLYGNAITSQIKSIGINSENFNKTISDCNRGTEIEKLYCVSYIIDKNFKYTSAHSGVQEIDYTFKNGGVCKDYAKIWSFVAEKYNFNNELIYVDKSNKEIHVFNLIYGDNFYCIADMNMLHCKSYTE